MTPHWQFLHGGWVLDFRFELKQVSDLKDLLKKHPDSEDKIGEVFREMIKSVKNRMTRMNKEYEKIYCGKVEL